jgi:hypothetical protein
MPAIGAMLPDDDGVKWFNFLYLRVTEDGSDPQQRGRGKDIESCAV